MEAEFWLEKWQKPTHGWTQQKANSRLVRYWPELFDTNAAPEVRDVLVPLCGDSIDMDWLVATGNRVCGCDLSQNAFRVWGQRQQVELEEVAAPASTETTLTHSETLTHWSVAGEWPAGVPLSGFAGELSVGINGLQKPHFIAGNFLDVEVADLPFQPQAAYDRAALVAMSPDLREAYASRLAKLLPAGARLLLITMAYDQSKMKGPPFSVSDENVRELFHTDFEVERLATSNGPDILGSLSERGLETLDESVFRLIRKG